MALHRSALSRLSAVQMLVLFLQTDFVCRLVRGKSLRKFLTDSCMPVVIDAPSILQHEQVVMDIAAQLLQVGVQQFAMLRVFQPHRKHCQSEPLKIVQTVHLLHVGSNTAHLDITSSNIMHCTEGYHVWNQLRLIDFGFSQMCTKGKRSSLESSSEHHASELACCARVNPTRGFFEHPNCILPGDR